MEEVTNYLDSGYPVDVIYLGSVLGPLLFVIYRPINDTDDSVACKILKFADDTKI